MRVTAVEVPTRVLIFGMARPDGTIPADNLYDVADACGQTPEQVRSCLRRLLRERLLEQEGAGRDAVYRTTPAGEELRSQSMQRHSLAWRQDTQGQGWDGQWHLAAFVIPEGRRSARDRLREQLVDAGGAAITNGLYVCPHPWEDEVRRIAADLGVADKLTLAATGSLEVGGQSDPRAIARGLWPVDDLAEAYRAFVKDHEHVLPALEALQRRRDRISDRSFLPGALSMVVAFQQVFLRDPVLPPELLPRPWPGRAARDLLLRCRRHGLRLRAEHERPALFAELDRWAERR